MILNTFTENPNDVILPIRNSDILDSIIVVVARSRIASNFLNTYHIATYKNEKFCFISGIINDYINDPVLFADYYNFNEGNYHILNPIMLRAKIHRSFMEYTIYQIFNELDILEFITTERMERNTNVIRFLESSLRELRIL